MFLHQLLKHSSRMVPILRRRIVKCNLYRNITIQANLWNDFSSSSFKNPDLINLNSDETNSFLVLPDIPNIDADTNEFLTIPTTGEIPFDKLNVEKCIFALGKLSIEFEHFIDEYSNLLKQEFENKDISNAKLNEFIAEMERHLMPLNYNLYLLLCFRFFYPEEYNFKTFDDFYSRRVEKSRLRFKSRSIYCFMCEMKARHASFIQQDSKDSKDNSKSNLEDEIKFQNEQKRQIVEKYIRQAKLEGLGLKKQDKLAFYEFINKQLYKAEAIFEHQLNEANRIFQTNIMSPQFLDCLPDYVITQLNDYDVDSVFNSFMKYCPDQTLRKDFWLSYHARASPFLESKLNNIHILEKIRDFRRRKAQLLGYENYAEMAMKLYNSNIRTMAGNIENVNAFINGLSNRTEAKFKENFKEITDFSMEFQPDGKRAKNSPSTFMPSNIMTEKLNLWDIKYLERLFLRERYQVNSVDVRAYFPLDRVISGMFEFTEKLFGIKIVEAKDKNVWNKNVRHFKIFDDSGLSNAEYGSFYFDPFQKVSSVFSPIFRSESLLTKPVAIFSTNFTSENSSVYDQFEREQQQTKGKELLNMSQVMDLFGLFGYVMQHLLTQVDYSEIAGVENLETDAFTMVYYFMRMWPLNSYPLIRNCTSHFKTGEPMPEKFFERIRKSHYHFVSFPLKYELYLIALDLSLHTTKDHSLRLIRKTWDEWMKPFESIPDNGHICSWSELFNGSDRAGKYYNRKWSEVIASDIFDAFREKGYNNEAAMKQMGQRFKETFLAQGGAIEMNELFRRFLGRDPTLNGYLTINGFE